MNTFNQDKPIINVTSNPTYEKQQYSTTINQTTTQLPTTTYAQPPVSVVGVTKSQVRPVEVFETKKAVETVRPVETFTETKRTTEVVETVPRTTETVLPMTTAYSTATALPTSTVVDNTLVEGTYVEKPRLRDRLFHRHNKTDVNDGIADTGKLGYPANDIYANPGLAGVETYREGPGNLLTHKATNQTHFNEPILDRAGPGYTNGDIYDRPGFAGVETHHQGPIDKLAAKLVGMRYSHEPMLDRAYVEPQNMGPIDKLAHKIVDHKYNKHAHDAAFVNTGLPATTTTTTVTKTEVVEGHQGVFTKLKNKIRGHEDVIVEDKALGGSNVITKY